MLSKWIVFLMPILLLSGNMVNVLQSPPTFEIDVTIAASFNVSGSNGNTLAFCSSRKLIVAHPDIDPNDSVNKLPKFQWNWTALFQYLFMNNRKGSQIKHCIPLFRALTAENHNKLSYGRRKQMHVMHGSILELNAVQMRHHLALHCRMENECTCIL